MSAVITVVVTVFAVAPIVALASGLYIYIKFACPAISQARRYYSQLQETEIDLADERRTRADIVKWIEHECRTSKAYNIESALKQRIDERLEVLRQLRLQRQQIRQVYEARASFPSLSFLPGTISAPRAGPRRLWHAPTVARQPPINELLIIP